MNKHIIIGLYFLSTLCSTTRAAGPLKAAYSYKHYTTDDGLPSMKSQCLVQDARGFIWLAGISGLTRFDGFEFKTYLKGTFANLNRISTNERGEVCAFTANQMYTVDEKADTIICTELMSKEYEMTSESSKNLPPGYGIFRNMNERNRQYLYAIKDTGLVKVLEHKDLHTFEDYNTTYYDEANQLLYLPYDDDIHVVSGKDGEVHHYDLMAISFCRYNNNEVLALTSTGIYRLYNRKQECILKHDIDYAMGGKIYAGTKGTIFFSTHEGLYRYQQNRIDTLFTANIIKDFIVDKDENIWVATYQGLYNLFRLDFRTYALPDRDDVVRNVVYRPDNHTVIAATLNGKIYEIDSNHSSRQLPYTASPHGVAYFNDYGCAAGGTIYLPGPGDILALNDKRSQWMNLPFHPSQLFVTALPGGDLMAGGVRRLFRITSQGKVLSDLGREKIKQNIYAKPCADALGRLWLGGYSGITIYDLASDSVTKTIFNDEVRLLRFMNTDREGNVWLASENRLFISDRDTVRLVRTFDSLIQGIFFTRTNMLVLSTLSGVYVFDRKQEHYAFYNNENGYTGREAASGSMIEDERGNIWLPSLTGLFCFNPEELLRNQPKPKLYLLSEASSTDNIGWEQLGTETATLNHRHNNLRFGYIGLSYTSAQNVRYRYRLSGFQNEWSEAVPAREVTFNNLPPGSYEFQLKAHAGTEGTETDIISRSFTIKPAFWQTVWFPVASALLLMLLSAVLALYFQQRKNKTLLDRLETEKQLNELRIKTIRLKAIPHFNANVLAAIEYYIMNKSKDEATALLGIYSRFTYQTLSEVDKASRSLSEELEYVKMYLELEKLRFLDKFDYRIEVDPNIDSKVQLPNMILHTYCENAIKHGLSPKESGGILSIKAVQTGNCVDICVEDNGVGREAAVRNKNVRSSKQGLDILSRQIEIYNRFNKLKITQIVEDLFAEGQAAGTRFRVEVPVDFLYV